MKYDIVIKNAQIVNKGDIIHGDVAIKDGKFMKIAGSINSEGSKEINAKGKYLMPGIIDDQVHFREPGYMHKANIQSESRAAVIGGVTSFMEMPNTNPTSTTQEELEKKYVTASEVSPANYSFFMGASNNNLDEVLRTDRQKVCGVKIFMGSSTGNMLVDNEKALDGIFRNVDMLIATHCEDEETVKRNTQKAIEKFGRDIPIAQHPVIRDVKACYLSSSKAVDLAKKHNTRLHILHISTAKELDLFTNDIPLIEKRITAEACVHHLYFDSNDYACLGTKIKCNPAIKHPKHKHALWKGLMDNRLDIIATDHAPHTAEEKKNYYLDAPSGLPLVQHSIHIMLDFYRRGMISLEKIASKMSHAPAICFEIDRRGYIEEGYHADAYLLDPNDWTHITKDQIAYKCNWSPLEGRHMPGKVLTTFVNGNIVYHDGKLNPKAVGERMEFRKG